MLKRLLLFLTLVPLTVLAGEPRMPLVAVLELKVQNRAIDLDTAVTLGNLVRARVVSQLGGAVKLVAQEKVLEILQRAATRLRRVRRFRCAKKVGLHDVWPKARPPLC